MRRISLNELNDLMVLAKPIYQGTRLILERDISCMTKYIKQLENLGIYSLYVKDECSEDITIPDAVCEETRDKCVAAVSTIFDRLKQQGNFDASILNDALETLLHDIFSQKDILVSLHHIATIDDDTMIHCVNTTVYSVLIGKRDGFSHEDLMILAKGTILHDVGKVDLNESILLKAASLTPEEFSHIKEHSTFGYTLLKQNDLLPEEARIIALQHHERLDGSGYPNGLKGDEIHPYAQIAAVADMFDALTTVRCYRKSLSNHKAYKILTEDAAAGKLNKHLVDCLFHHVAVYPNGIVVHLSDGTHGIVKQQNPGQPFRPIVRIIDDTHGMDNVTLYDLDLSKRKDISIKE
ncbi:MAG: HD-GYP domain-containing protein [Lachnospiraceae bacterium]|nr:HD-GYP domain-containing protein [Lachnospiraceae bacterium]